MGFSEKAHSQIPPQRPHRPEYRYIRFILCTSAGSLLVIDITENIGEMASEDGTCSSLAAPADGSSDTDPDVHLQWHTALFLLRVSQEHFLTHDGVESFCNTVQSFAEKLCNGIAQKVEMILSKDEMLDEFLKQDVLDACKPGTLFYGLTGRYARENYYETHFNYKV